MWHLHKWSPHYCFCEAVGKQLALSTTVLKGDSMSGLAGDYISVIAFGIVSQRSHPYETWTCIHKVQCHHAISISWLGYGSCGESGSKPSAFCRHVQRCEQCAPEYRQPVDSSQPKVVRPQASYKAHMLLMKLYCWAGSHVHILWTHCVWNTIVHAHLEAYIHNPTCLHT